MLLPCTDCECVYVGCCRSCVSGMCDCVCLVMRGLWCVRSDKGGVNSPDPPAKISRLLSTSRRIIKQSRNSEDGPKSMQRPRHAWVWTQCVRLEMREILRPRICGVEGSTCGWCRWDKQLHALATNYAVSAHNLQYPLSIAISENFCGHWELC